MEGRERYDDFDNKLIEIGVLSESLVCRLCGEPNTEVISMYDSLNEYDIKTTINRYLPLKVDETDNLPRVICPGCHIQLFATTKFFDSIIAGQKILKKYLEREIAKSKDVSKAGLLSPDVNQFFGEEHIMKHLMQPRRKRGRPRRVVNKEQQHEVNEQRVDKKKIEDEPAYDKHGKLIRRRKVPNRFMHIQGKELKKCLKEEGAIDSTSSSSSPSSSSSTDGNDEDENNTKDSNNTKEIIGLVKNADGKSEPIKISNPSSYNSFGSAARKTNLRIFICDFCNCVLKDRARSMRHRFLHKDLRFRCGHLECPLLFTTKNKFKLHQSESGHNEQPSIVKLIDKVNESDVGNVPAYEEVENSFNLSENKSVVELSNEQLVERTNSQQDTNKQHATKKSGGSLYQCEKCDRVFQHHASYTYHMQSAHNNTRAYLCLTCNKSFKHKQILIRHQSVHSTERPFACTICNQRFKTQSNLINHRVVHTGEKRFACPKCKNTFAHQTSLKLHLKWHVGSREFACDTCGKQFSQKGNLREHMRIHSGERPYSCTVCGKRTITQSQMRQHARVHTGERPYKCSYCTKQFTHKDIALAHERRHIGLKPFACECGKRFIDATALKRHSRLHTGERPHKCQLCDGEYADYSNLLKHRRAAHGVVAGTLKNLVELTSAQGNEYDDRCALVAAAASATIAGSVPEDENLYLIPDSVIQGDDTVDPGKARQEGADDGATAEETTIVLMGLPDGATAEIVSWDFDTGLVHLRTSTGHNVELILPSTVNTLDTIALDEIKNALVTVLNESSSQQVQNVEEQYHSFDREELTMDAITESIFQS